MKLSALLVILVMVAAAASQGCNRVICTPMFFKDMRKSKIIHRTDPRMVHKDFSAKEAFFWKAQSLVQGTIWDFHEFIFGDVKKFDETNKLFKALQDGVMVPTPFPIPAERIKTMLLNAFSPRVRPAQIMPKEEFEWNLRTKVRLFLAWWQRAGGSETAKDVLNIIMKYVSCLFPQSSVGHVQKRVQKAAEEFISIMEEVEKRGNYSIWTLEEVNPRRFKQFKSVISEIYEEEGWHRTKARLKKFFTDYQDSIKREISALVDAAEIVLGLGNCEYPGTEIYLSSLYYSPEYEFKRMLQQNTVSSVIEYLGWFVVYYVDLFKPGFEELWSDLETNSELTNGFEPLWKSLEQNLPEFAELPPLLKDVSGGLVKKQPIPACINSTDKFPEIKPFGLTLELQDYAVLRILQFYILQAYL